MQTGEFFAKLGQLSATNSNLSAQRMEEWTEKMHDIAATTKQETISMHIITVWTLVFLPGTFVAVRYGVPYLKGIALLTLTTCQTFFSSGILDFTAREVLELGDWDTRWGALKLFAVICVPIMVFTLAVWGFFYWGSWRRSRRKHARVSAPHTTKEKAAAVGLGISNRV
jgi:hypothetical protein